MIEVVPSARDAAGRVFDVDWDRVSSDLDAQGNAPIECLLSPDECDALAMLYRTTNASAVVS